MLQLSFRISRLELAGLWISYCVAQVGIVQAGLPVVARVLLSLVLALLCLGRAREVLMQGRNSLQRLALGADGRAVLCTREGEAPAHLSRVVYRSGWLMVLDFRLRAASCESAGCRAGRRLLTGRRVLILPDSIGPAEKRRLAVLLRCLADSPV